MVCNSGPNYAAERNNSVDDSCSGARREWHVKDLDHGMNIKRSEAVIQVSEIEG